MEIIMVPKCGEGAVEMAWNTKALVPSVTK